MFSFYENELEKLVSKTVIKKQMIIDLNHDHDQ